MATTNFMRLPFSVSFAGATMIDETLAAPVFVPGIEAAAQEHWLFGTSAASLTGLKAGGVLTPTSGGNLPTYASGKLTIKDGGLYGLQSAIADSANQTICVVASYRASGGGIAVTTQNTGSSPGQTVYLDPTTTALGFRTQGYSPTTQVCSRPSAIADGEMMFLALSQSTGGRIGFCGSGGTVSASGTKTVTTRNISLGNSYNSTTGYDKGLAFAELIVFDSALTQAEIEDVYVRSRARLSARGIYIR